VVCDAEVARSLSVAMVTAVKVVYWEVAVSILLVARDPVEDLEATEEALGVRRDRTSGGTRIRMCSTAPIASCTCRIDHSTGLPRLDIAPPSHPGRWLQREGGSRMDPRCRRHRHTSRSRSRSTRTTGMRHSMQ